MRPPSTEFIGALSTPSRTARLQAKMHTPMRRTALSKLKSSSARCMASYNEGEKSWSQIAGDAFNLAKAAGTKLTNSIVEAGNKLFPRKDPEPSQQDWRRPLEEENPFRLKPQAGRQIRQRTAGSDPINDLFGSLVRGMVGGELARGMNAGADSSADIMQRSLWLMERNSQVANILGPDIRVSPGSMGNMTSTSIINGRKRKQTTVTFNVRGSGGTAFAQAEVSNESDGEERLGLTLQWPGGGEVYLTEDGDDPDQSGGRPPIDVEWREVR